MASSTYIINKEEENTRKQWLQSTFFLLLFYPLGMLLLFVILSIWIDIPQNVMFLSFAETLLGLIPMTTLWYFAYRNCGTRILTLSLFFGPCKQIGSIGQLATETLNTWTISFVVIQFAIFIYWYIQSLTTRKINSLIRKRT